MRSGRPEVVVTGLGLVTGLGDSAEATWAAMKQGRSAARVLVGPGLPAKPPHIGFPTHPTLHPGIAWIQILGAHSEAWAQSGLADRIDPSRIATLFGMSKPDVRSSEFWQDCRDDPDQAEVWWPAVFPNSAASRLAFNGPSLTPIAACATGLVAVLQGAAMIRRGVCDIAFCGSTDASLSPLWLAAFRKMRVLARTTDDPRQALRPWDRARSGFLVGEGAAVMILERADHARARGARPIAVVAGGALGSDAYHETNLNPDPTGLAHLIGRALDDAGVDASEIDHVNVHGTATGPNDPLECRALRRALGRHAERVSCSANKAQIGHLLGAAGSAELAITCLAIRDGFVPPTLNLTDPDPACDLDGTPLVGRARPIRAALKLSIGFGGHLAAAVLRHPEARS